MSHTLINCMIEIWRQNSEIHPAFACSRWPPWFLRSFQTVRRMREAWKWETCSVSVFLVRVGSPISTSGEARFEYPLPWESKISQMPYPRTNKDNQITHNTDRCVTECTSKMTTFIRDNMTNLHRKCKVAWDHVLSLLSPYVSHGKRAFFIPS